MLGTDKVQLISEVIPTEILQKLQNKLVPESLSCCKVASQSNEKTCFITAAGTEQKWVAADRPHAVRDTGFQ